MRTYLIKADGKEFVEYQGSFSYGRMDAVRDYLKDFYPEWVPCSSGQRCANQGDFVWYKAEAINKDQTLGMSVWIKESY